ncbi:hypothetical protein R6Q59_021592 [Mikania micrantha]
MWKGDGHVFSWTRQDWLEPKFGQAKAGWSSWCCCWAICLGRACAQVYFGWGMRYLQVGRLGYAGYFAKVLGWVLQHFCWFDYILDAGLWSIVWPNASLVDVLRSYLVNILGLDLGYINILVPWLAVDVGALLAFMGRPDGTCSWPTITSGWHTKYVSWPWFYMGLAVGFLPREGFFVFLGPTKVVREMG